MKKPMTRSLKKHIMPRKDARLKVTPEMIDILIDPKNVHAWATKSLDERAILLHRLYPMARITGSYLGILYKRNKIKFKQVVMKKLMSKVFKGKILK